MTRCFCGKFNLWTIHLFRLDKRRISHPSVRDIFPQIGVKTFRPDFSIVSRVLLMHDSRMMSGGSRTELSDFIYLLREIQVYSATTYFEKTRRLVLPYRPKWVENASPSFIFFRQFKPHALYEEFTLTHPLAQ